MKKYVAVEFSNSSHAVVLNSWISKKNNSYYCAWPSSEVENKIHNNASPESNWKIYKIKVLDDSSKFYIDEYCKTFFLLFFFKASYELLINHCCIIF